MNDRESLDPYCLRPGEAAGLLRGHPWRRFVVLGDSVAEGLGEPSPGYRDVSWTDRIADALRAAAPDLVYRNLGTRNLPAAEVRARQLADALDFEPDLALIACGGFDVMQRGFDGDAVSGELEAIIAPLWARSCDVITVGLFDGSYSPYVPDRFRDELRRRLWELADRTEAISVAHGGMHVSLTGHPAAQDPDLYGSDGRHGTRRSHAISAAECVRRLAGHEGCSKPRPSDGGPPWGVRDRPQPHAWQAEGLPERSVTQPPAQGDHRPANTARALGPPARSASNPPPDLRSTTSVPTKVLNVPHSE